MAGVGFDADVVERLHAARSGNISHWSYAKPLWQSIRKYRYAELRVQCAQRTIEGASTDLRWSEPIRCRWAFVFNLPRYGAGLKFAPAANGTDELLDLCTFRRGGLVFGLGYLASVLTGIHSHLPGCQTAQCQRIRIESDEPVPYELDGDPGGMLPVEFEVAPQRLRLLVPKDWE